MRQRLGIAQAIAGDPRLIIVDEPTAGLDPEERLRFYRLLSELAADRIVLLSTHIVEDVAVLCPRFAVIRDGRLIADTTPGEARRAIEGTIYEGTSPPSPTIGCSPTRALRHPGVSGRGPQPRPGLPAGRGPAAGLRAGRADPGGRLPRPDQDGRLPGYRRTRPRAQRSVATRPMTSMTGTPPSEVTDDPDKPGRACDGSGRSCSATSPTSVRRPLFIVWALILVLTAWGLSSGVMLIQSGDATVGRDQGAHHLRVRDRASARDRDDALLRILRRGRRRDGDHPGRRMATGRAAPRHAAAARRIHLGQVRGGAGRLRRDRLASTWRR